MKTKHRIIKQAINEYNHKGVSNVTSRDLAKKLNMSHGNLEYHFKNKEALITTIYQQMREEMEAYMGEDVSEDLFTRFDKLLHNINDFQKKYAFFNLDFVEISRKYKAVNTLIRETFLLRERQLEKFFSLFVDQGYLKFPDKESQAIFVHSIYVLITFWIPQNEFLPFRHSSGSASLPIFIWDMVLPRMTESGKKRLHTFQSAMSA